MLSYKHGFHAANFADLHKHISLCIALQSFKDKGKPFCYYDTHAGSGLYDLKSQQAQKNKEYKQGVGPLYLRLIEGRDGESLTVANIVRDYVNNIKRFNSGGIAQYPGSPLLAEHFLQPQDDMVLMELHPAEHRKLKALVAGNDLVHTHHRDGLEGLVSLVPPQQKRGLVLIDPSYEVKKEYTQVREAVLKAYKRWSQGVFIIWYPILAEQRHTGLLTEFQRCGIKKIFHTQYLKAQEATTQKSANVVTAQNRHRGMLGSGLLIINPPWKFPEQSHTIFRNIIKNIYPADEFRGEWLVSE